MMVAKVTVAINMRMAADKLGPSAGAEIRVSMNDMPHSPESATNWKKYLAFIRPNCGSQCLLKIAPKRRFLRDLRGARIG